MSDTAIERPLRESDDRDGEQDRPEAVGEKKERRPKGNGSGTGDERRRHAAGPVGVGGDDRICDDADEKRGRQHEADLARVEGLSA